MHRFWPFSDPLVVNQRFTRCCERWFQNSDSSFKSVWILSPWRSCRWRLEWCSISLLHCLLGTSRFSSTVLAEHVHMSGSLVPAVLISGCPFCLERWVRFGWRRTFVPTSEWWVLRRALWLMWVMRTQFSEDFLQIPVTRISWGQWRDLGWRQDAPCCSLVARNVYRTRSTTLIACVHFQKVYLHQSGQWCGARILGQLQFGRWNHPFTLSVGK